MGRFKKKKRFKQPEQAPQPVRKPQIIDDSLISELEILEMTAVPLPQTELAVSLQAEMKASLGKLMYALGIKKKEYMVEPVASYLSLKERFGFVSKDDCDRAMEAVKGILRITRTEYFEMWNPESTEIISPYRHFFVAVADNKNEFRTTENAYRTMIDALEEAGRRVLNNTPSPE